MIPEYGIKTVLFPGGPDIVVMYTRGKNHCVNLTAVLQNGRADRCLLEELTNDKVISFKKQCADQWSLDNVEQLTAS